MWSKLDDALIDHRKIFAAGELIGRNGAVVALGFYALGLMWTNKHLTDGRLPVSVVRSWRHASQPLKVAEALVSANLWEQNGDGYIIHDFHDHNFTESERLERRVEQHAVKVRAGRLGGLKSAETRRRQREATKQSGKQDA